MPKSKLIFVNRYFYPDHSATAQILSDLAFDLARRGWRVEVITSRGGYDAQSASLPAREIISGVHIYRVWSTSFGRMRLAGRMLDYLSFYLSALIAMVRRCRRGDVLIAKTDPPMLSVLAAAAARVRGGRLVNWLQDLYPEVAEGLGITLAGGPTGGLLRALRNRSLQAAKMNVAIGELMAERIRNEHVPPDRVAVLPNWTDDDAIRPGRDAGIGLRKEWRIERDFVIGYSGNLGRAHDIDTMLEAATILRGEASIRFLFIGGGSGLAELARRVEAAGLTNFLFKPYQPKEALAESLAVPDVHWITLLPELEGLIVPSKCYGIAAAARPMLFIGSENGDLAKLIRDHGCGIAVAQGAADRLADAIRRLAANPHHCRDLGLAARSMLDRHFSRRRTLDGWNHLLERAAADGA
jgi:glycosyltransferase involved in cell wall biosynthesis